MPKLIVKARYLKKSFNRSRMLEYIGTRTGVIKNMISIRDKPATKAQEDLINELSGIIPGCKTNPLYRNYQTHKTIGTASELISDIFENHSSQLEGVEKYLEYIGSRPQVKKLTTNGLFNDEEEAINMTKAKQEISSYDGNIYTLIVSMKREDASRLDYDQLESWKLLLRADRNRLAEGLKIDPKNLVWYAAFHDESYHPHVHIMLWSKDPHEGYLSKEGIENIRSVLANDIFKEDLLPIYKKQTYFRDEIKRISRYQTESFINSLNDPSGYSKEIQTDLYHLHTSLSDYNGRLVYGYLPKKDKALVNKITDELGNDKRIKELLEQWWKLKEEILHNYTDATIKQLPLSEISEFKPIKNIIVKVVSEPLKINEMELPSIYKQPSDNQDWKPSESEVSFHYAAKLFKALSQMLDEMFIPFQNVDHNIDRKLWNKIEELKQAQGHKLG